MGSVVLGVMQGMCGFGAARVVREMPCVSAHWEEREMDVWKRWGYVRRRAGEESLWNI